MAQLPQLSGNLLYTGGVLLPGASGLICLMGYCGAAKNTTLRRAQDSAGYAVTAGKSFQVLAIVLDVTTAAAGANLNMNQTDNDCGVSTATAQTNPAPPGGVGLNGVIASAATAGRLEVPGFGWSIAATKFLTISTDAGSVYVIKVYGREV